MQIQSNCKVRAQITGSEIGSITTRLLEQFEFGTVTEARGVWVNPETGETADERSVTFELTFFDQPGMALVKIVDFANVLGILLDDAGEHSVYLEVYFRGKFTAFLTECANLGDEVSDWACPF